MAKPNKKKQETGIRAGLKAAFAFLPAFMLLRYGIPRSLFFAAIGGISVGVISRWWQNSEAAKPKLHPFAKLKFRPRKRYPGLQDVRSRTSARGFLRQQKSPNGKPSGD
jgi:hypothetical protein